MRDFHDVLSFILDQPGASQQTNNRIRQAVNGKEALLYNSNPQTIIIIIASYLHDYYADVSLSAVSIQVTIVV